MIFHPLNSDIASPQMMNNPFGYEPDELTMCAVDDLQRHLKRVLPVYRGGAMPVVRGRMTNNSSLSLQQPEGKMFGVLVVKDDDGRRGYLAAYSGQIDGAFPKYITKVEGKRELVTEADEKDRNSETEGFAFVPPVFDYLQPDGKFKTEEREISEINHRIELLEKSTERRRIVKALEDATHEADDIISRKKAVMTAAKALRDRRRKEAFLSEKDKEEMTRESQFLKAEVHRAKQHYRDVVDGLKEALSDFDRQLTALKDERKKRSDALQQWLFSQFRLHDAKGDSRSLIDIFADYYENNTTITLSEPWRGIPSGAGECCEPKLLEYAFSHGLHPLSMACFWWGADDKVALRHHGEFYPACSGKCKPILSWMLRGLDIAPNKYSRHDAADKLQIVYEDDHLAVVDKPSGMLAAPGKDGSESVISLLEKRWTGSKAFSIHRLDMATSGLMVVARDQPTQKALQRQFRERKVKKRYRAIVVAEAGKALPPMKGKIDLPLSADIANRPRQRVDMENGRRAVTLYEIKSTRDADDGRREMEVELWPMTGRTHQLRVHCASPDGLGCPIKGDEIYGHSGGLLCLNAEYLEFTNPATGKRMRFTCRHTF